MTHIYDVDLNLGRHAYVCSYDDWHGLVENVYSRVKIMLEILTLHPTDGASVDKPFQGLWKYLQGSNVLEIAFSNKVPNWTRENLVNLDRDQGIYSLINR